MMPKSHLESINRELPGAINLFLSLGTWHTFAEFCETISEASAWGECKTEELFGNWGLIKTMEGQPGSVSKNDNLRLVLSHLASHTPITEPMLAGALSKGMPIASLRIMEEFCPLEPSYAWLHASSWIRMARIYPCSGGEDELGIACLGSVLSREEKREKGWPEDVLDWIMEKDPKLGAMRLTDAASIVREFFTVWERETQSDAPVLPGSFPKSLVPMSWDVQQTAMQALFHRLSGSATPSAEWLSRPLKDVSSELAPNWADVAVMADVMPLFDYCLQNQVIPAVLYERAMQEPQFAKPLLELKLKEAAGNLPAASRPRL